MIYGYEVQNVYNQNRIDTRRKVNGGAENAKRMRTIQ